MNTPNSAVGDVGEAEQPGVPSIVEAPVSRRTAMAGIALLGTAMSGIASRAFAQRSAAGSYGKSVIAAQPASDAPVKPDIKMSFDSVQFVDVDGLRIRYLRGAKRSGIPVLLTSPWPESLFAFHRIWPSVAERWEVVAVDLPGFGRSEGRPDVLSPKGIANFIPRILDALGLVRVHAVGPDIGTPAFLLSASQHPDRFESLVVGSGATDVATAAGNLKNIISAPTTSAFESKDGAEFAVGAIKRMMRTAPDPRVLDDYAASSAGRRFVEATAYVRAYPSDLPALRELLPSIHTPVLSIWGTQDPLVPPINAELLDKSLPRTRSLLIESSHFVWEDEAEAYAHAVVEWIEGGYRTV